jgi:hypothetical protein
VLQLLSFFIVLTLLSGTIALIVMTIRNASETISGALRGEMPHNVTSVTFVPRAIRQSCPANPYRAPLRAAA